MQIQHVLIICFRIVSLWIWTIRQKSYQLIYFESEARLFIRAMNMATRLGLAAQQLQEHLRKMSHTVPVDRKHPRLPDEDGFFHPLFFQSGSFAGSLTPSQLIVWLVLSRNMVCQRQLVDLRETPSSLPWYISPLLVASRPSYVPFLSSQIFFQFLLCISLGNLCMG